MKTRRSTPGFVCAALWVAAGLTGSAVRGQPGPGEAALRRHDEIAAAWRATGLDAGDADAVFAHVFSRLPDRVPVLPTENYFYWQLIVDGRELRGNFRLAPGDRECGRLHFAYSEWEEFPAGGTDRLRREKVLDVLRRGSDDFVWTAASSGKSVTFHLNRLPQHLPANLRLSRGELFVQRTFDESGLGFVLLFDDEACRFLWVLDEERLPAEHWRELYPGLLQGRRTGFVFQQRAGRKELLAVRGQSVDRNDFYDGPFDQLADNYATQSCLRACLEKWRPALRGRIDDLGRFIDAAAPARVAIVPYHTYYTEAEAVRAGMTFRRDPPATESPEDRRDPVPERAAGTPGRTATVSPPA